MGLSSDAEMPEQLAEHRGVDPSSLRAPEHDPAATVELPGFLEDLQGPPRQGNPVLALRLHAVGGNGPDIVLDLVPRRAPDLVRARRGQDHELERQPDTGMRLRVADLGQSRRDLAVRERLVMPGGVAVAQRRWRPPPGCPAAPNGAAPTGRERPPRPKAWCRRGAMRVFTRWPPPSRGRSRSMDPLAGRLSSAAGSAAYQRPIRPPGLGSRRPITRSRRTPPSPGRALPGHRHLPSRRITGCRGVGVGPASDLVEVAADARDLAGALALHRGRRGGPRPRARHGLPEQRRPPGDRRGRSTSGHPAPLFAHSRVIDMPWNL